MVQQVTAAGGTSPAARLYACVARPKPTAARHPVSRVRYCTQLSVLLCGQAAACVLPGVQRTDGIAVRVHIQNAVHLPGHADGMNIRIAFKQRFDNRKCDLCDLFHVLLACARQRRRNKGTVCPRFAGEKLPSSSTAALIVVVPMSMPNVFMLGSSVRLMVLSAV